MTQQRRVAIVLGLNVTMILGLLVVGLASHSLSVLAAGGDFIADAMALGLGLLAIRLRARGHERATTYVAAVNGGLLLILSVVVVATAVRRLLGHSVEVHGLPVLVVSLVSALVMGLGAVVLGLDAGSEDLHMRSVLLDTAGDALAAFAVAVAGAVIWLTSGYYWVDPALAVVIGLVVAGAAAQLLWDVATELRAEA